VPASWQRSLSSSEGQLKSRGVKKIDYEKGEDQSELGYSIQDGATSIESHAASIQNGTIFIQSGAVKKDNCCEGGPAECQNRAARYVKNRIGSCEAGWSI
jgi:hypothetical protein